jgi:hypothetical protein
VEQVEPVFVDATQIAAPQRHAMTIEEFEYLDCYLTAIVESVAKRRCSELTVGGFGRCVCGYFNHLGHHDAKKKMIGRYFVDLADAAKQFQESPNIGLTGAGNRANVANARRTKSLFAGNAWPYTQP